jgi:hypothetical protein
MNEKQPGFNGGKLSGAININSFLTDRYGSYHPENNAGDRRKPLPEKLYHVTTEKSAQQIIQDGLNPSKLYFEDREVVSLSDDINFAIRVAAETQNVDPKIDYS